MEQLRGCVLVAVFVSVCGCDFSADPSEFESASHELTSAEMAALAEWWSPLIYQDTASGNSDGRYYYKHDYFTKFNYDGDYNGANNWDNLRFYDATPVIYYSVSETSGYYLIGYYLYYPRDAAGPDSDTHENDMEGAILVIRKPSSECSGSNGCLLAVVTEEHGAFRRYRGNSSLANDVTTNYGSFDGAGADVQTGSISAGRDGVAGTGDDGSPGVHVKLFSESGGHGIFACNIDGYSCTSALGDDGIVYYHSDGAGLDPVIPDPVDGGAGNYVEKYPYRLLAMDNCDYGVTCSISADRGLWSRRYERNDNSSASCASGGTCPFRDWGRFNGDTSHASPVSLDPDPPNTTQVATPPWAWDNVNDDGPTFAGDWFCDPAKMFDVLFDGTHFDTSEFDNNYATHAYWTHYVEVKDVMVDTSAFGSTPDVWVMVKASNVPLNYQGNPVGSNLVMDSRHWRKNDATKGIWYPWRYGYYDADPDVEYGAISYRHYFCRPVEVHDADDKNHEITSITWEVAAVEGLWFTSGDHFHTEAAFDHLTGIDMGDVRLKFRDLRNPQNSHE